MSEPKRKGRGRLSRSGDFERAYREGESHSNRFVILYSFPRPPDEDTEGARLGVSVGRNVGGAVERNRVKRALREAFRPLADRVPDRYDYVLVARPDIRGLVEREGTDGVAACLEDVIRDSGIGRRTV
ncbi:MAG TPA: ribonuclease P protein component [Solirubrobacterales bacterium]|jgi:ribonuclease P protein component|nr:ribonuclease P protein component [Solirubrobacterales bacterium]